MQIEDVKDALVDAYMASWGKIFPTPSLDGVDEWLKLYDKAKEQAEINAAEAIIVLLGDCKLELVKI